MHKDKVSNGPEHRDKLIKVIHDTVDPYLEVYSGSMVPRLADAILSNFDLQPSKEKMDEKNILLNAIINLEGRATYDRCCSFCNLPLSENRHQDYCIIAVARKIIEKRFKEND